MKLTKEQTTRHDQAEKILLKDELTFDDKYFVLENWLPGATNNITKSGEFFTPRALAHEFCYEVGTGNVVDLCAGIGMLSFQLQRFHSGKKINLTCIEINEDFVRVGKKILPEANWIHGDVLDENLIKSIGQFDYVMSNPPFGNIKTGMCSNWLKYKGSEFEYKVIEIGSYLAKNSGTFLLPQLSCPFRISTKRSLPVYDDSSYITSKYERFMKETNLSLSPNCGFDLSSYYNKWVGTSQICEIALCDYEEIREEIKAKQTCLQTSLFGW